MYHNTRHAIDRLHGYCCVKYPSYGAWHEHPYHSHTHWFLFTVFFAGWIMGLFFQLRFFPLQFAGAASYSWNQASWTGGATANNANHTSNQTGWTQYSAKDTNLTAAATLTLTQQNTTFTENFSATTYKDTSATTADWQTTNSLVQLDKTYFGTPTYVAITNAGQEVYVSGNYAYIAAGTGGLKIVDLNNTSNVYTRSLTTSARGIFVTGNYAYLAVGDGLAIVNVSDPTNPGTPVYKTLTASAGAFGVYVTGNYAYLADHKSGLAIVNVSDPTNPGTPVYKSTISTGASSGVRVSGSYAYVAVTSTAGGEANALEIFNVSDPTNPGTPVSKTLSYTVRGNSLAVSGNYAYVPVGNYLTLNDGAVLIVDVTDPTNPGTIYATTLTGVGRSVFVNGNYLYAGQNNGVSLFDITTPTSPSLLSTNSLGGDRGIGVYVTGNKVYAVMLGTNLAIMDSTPTVYNTPRVVQSLAVDTATDPIALATLTATSTLNGQTITYQLSRDGGTTWENVTSGVEYTFTATSAEKSNLRWKATLSTANTAQTPILSGISINYKYYPASQVLTSSQFNTEASTTQVTQIAWSETVPAGTNVRSQIRTAPDSSGSPGTWSDWLGPTSSTDYYETTPAGETVNSINSAGSDDQWMQYRAYLTSTGVNSPTLSSATILYNTFPATPSLSSATHPSQTTFYTSATPLITITAGTPTPDHYHYLVNQTASPTIAAVAAGTNTSGSFAVPSSPGDNTITGDGTWYVHVVAHDSGHTNSANFASYTIKRDATAPTSTTLSFGSITASSITASASASDTTAGLHATPYYFERNSGAANSGWIAGNWTDTGLSANTRYSYRVEARDAVPNISAFIAEQATYTAANTPSSSSVTTPTSSSLKVIVNTNGNPTGTSPAADTLYAIAVSTDNFSSDTRYVQSGGALGGSAAWQTYSQWGGASGTTVTGLTAQQTYTFKIKARNGDAVETSYSNATSSYTSATAPSNFHSTTVDTSSASITVDRFAGDTVGQAGYYFSRTGAVSGWLSTSTWSDGSLSPNTAYTYSVKTRDSNGVESGISTLDITTPAVAPSALSLDATRATDTTVQLTLATSSNPSTTTYAIHETTQNKYVQANGSLGSTAAWQTLAAWGTVTVSGLTMGTTYTFEIKAKNSQNTETNFSTTVSSATLAVPGTPTVNTTAAAQSSLELLPASSINPSSITYAIQETGGGKYVQADGTLGISEAWQTLAQWGTVTVAGLTTNTSYTFQVKAKNALGTATAFGGTVSGRTLAVGVPRAPTLPESGKTTAQLVVVVNATGLGAGIEFAILETTLNLYVQANGSLSNTAAWQTYAGWGGTSGVVVSGLSPRHSYTFRVKSRDPSAGFIESALGPGTTKITAGGANDETPPTLSTTMSVRSVEGSGIRLVWTDPPENDFARVIVFRSDTNAPPAGSNTYALLGKGIGSFTDTAVVAGATYQYVLRFEDDAGNGVVSQILRVTALTTEGVKPSTSTSNEELSVLPKKEQEQDVTPVSLPSAAQRTGSDINIKELIRIQYPSLIGTVNETEGCTSGQLVCSLNRLFSIEQVPGIQFIIDKLIPGTDRQESFRFRQNQISAPSSSTITIIGRFGLLYDVVPNGVASGASLPQPVAITLRYNPRDAVLILRPEYALALAYLHAGTNTWDTVADAVHDPAKGTFTARVSTAGTYGIVIIKNELSQ